MRLLQSSTTREGSLSRPAVDVASQALEDEVIARLARVSVATVSRSLNDSPLIPAGTRERIRRIAERKGFEFNAHARSLVTRRVGTIGIILPSDYERFSVNLYHGTLHNALRDVLERSDIDLIVAFLANRFTGRDNVRKLVTRKKVDGLLCSNHGRQP